MSVIEVEQLRKQYRRLRGPSTLAVDGLDLSVPEGGVFGFLGPNGAGKTTTIRCLLGLVAPTSGRCRLLGADCRSELHQVVGRTGAIVETPTLFPGFSGRRNLELLARAGGVGPRRVSEVLDLVDLAGRAAHRVKTYSLGMKQRLGLAAALLKDPEVLILDEPANGLDPAGIKEIRDLIRALGAQGRTVFVSSHILSEVEQMCDRVAILAHGRCVASGSVDEVLSRGKAGLVVKLDDLERGRATLVDAGVECVVEDGALHVALDASEGRRVSELLARRELFVSELRPAEANLEAVFLRLTQEPSEQAPA
jgi:ABC-2 type transport system ATP-binding protein